MFNIEYSIGLTNDGRPCIILPDDYEQNPEDKFFAIEIASYLLMQSFQNKIDNFSEDTKEKINSTITMLRQISDEMAGILWNQMKNMGDITLMLNNKYQIQVKNIDELNELLILKYVINNNKIFELTDGLKALVTEEMEIYELNSLCWIKINKNN